MIFNQKTTLLNTRATTVFLLIATAFYFYLAYRSSGYIQKDEHYQIIEFANYKLGLISAKDLAWEFSAKIRSGFQPLICFLILKVCYFFHIDNGYDLAFVLRALTGLLSIYVINTFVLTYKKYVSKRLKNIFIVGSFLLWFLPYINIRFSSENLSGLMLILALVLLDKSNYCKKKNPTYFMGIVLGLSILFRYQSMLFVSGIISWLFFVHKTKATPLLRISAGILMVLLVGVFVDFWLYGNWTLTILNYFNANIIQGVASKFGTSPIFQYLIYILQAPGIFGILILISFGLIIYYYPKNILVWVSVPFLLIHSIIPHKELRFLFPLANLCPLILIMGFQKASSVISKKTQVKRWKLGTLVWALIALTNILSLYAIASTGVGAGRIVVAEYIDRHYGRRDLKVTLIGDVNPFTDWQVAKNTYYDSDGFNLTKAVNMWQKEKVNNDFSVGRQHIYVIKEKEISGPMARQHLKAIGLKKVYQSIPDITLLLYSFYNKSLKDQQIYVFEGSDLNRPKSR